MLSSMRIAAAAAAVVVGMTSFAGLASGSDLYFYDSSGNRVTLRAGGLLEDGRTAFVEVADVVARPGRPAEPAAPLQTLSDRFVVQTAPGQDVAALARTWGVQVEGSLDFAQNHYILRADDGLAALRIANRAFEHGEAATVYTQFERQLPTRQIPNDPLFGQQWHLRNVGQSGSLVGHDVRVEPVWNFSAGTGLGRGVNVAVVDDALAHNHNDLAANYRSDLSYNFVNNNTNPFPTSPLQDHGTAVAGLIAARGNNGIGVTGVAPEAGVSGIRVLGGNQSDLTESQALSFRATHAVGGQFAGNHIYNNSWGPPDVGRRAAAGPLVRQALQNGIVNGRGGLGSIYVWAGGNGGNGDNVNFDGYANSRFTIAVGATTNSGIRASYSERGAALLVNAPSDGGSLGLVTTDFVSGNPNAYIGNFGGTSGSAPLVSGVVALILEANPDLTWRDVQHILVDTARRTDTGNPTWVQNGDGRFHSDLYGFGTVDASAAVAAAASWTNVDPAQVTSRFQSVNTFIPDKPSNQPFGPAVSSTVSLTDDLFVEHVEVTLNISHSFGGDLVIDLVSPSGP